jgi:oligopeptide transport system ATP-binding protein
MSGGHLAEARDVAVHFRLNRRLLSRAPPQAVRALDGFDLRVRRGETMALVGESGCGKSTAGRAFLRTVPITRGSVCFDGIELAGRTERSMLPLRRRMQMVFQDPFASLNPRMRIGETVAEPMIVHRIASGKALAEKVAGCLRMVELDAGFAGRFPHEFSGGQRQRVAIARAIAPEPDFIVADEPLSALDVSLQIQIIDLFQSLKDRLGLTYLFISHDLAVVSQFADRVAVMYLGAVVERADAAVLFRRPAHPYTQALLAAVPVPDPAAERKRVFAGISGEVPSPLAPPAGCRFHTRCPHVMPRCRSVAPRMVEIEPGHHVACHLHAGS